MKLIDLFLIICVITIVILLFLIAIKTSYSVGYKDGENGFAQIITYSLQTRKSIGKLNTTEINPVIVNFIRKVAG